MTRTDEATRQEEAVLKQAQAATAKMKKTTQQLLAEAREKSENARRVQTAKRRTGGIVVPLAKVDDDHVFRADELSAILNTLRSLKTDFEKRLKQHPNDKPYTANIQNIDELIELGNSKNFPGFVKKFRSVSRDFPEHRVAFLSSRRSSAGEIGAATVKKIENFITDIVKKQPPAKPAQLNVSRRNSSTLITELVFDADGKDQFGLSKWGDEKENGHEASVSSTKTYERAKSPNEMFRQLPPIIHTSNLKENQFLADMQRKLEIYLDHLQKNRQKALNNNAVPEELLVKKIEAVKKVLAHASKRDFNGFNVEWETAKVVIEKHRAKTVGGIKMKFTAVLPFEGKNLVKDVEKAKNKLNSPEMTKKR